MLLSPARRYIVLLPDFPVGLPSCRNKAKDLRLLRWHACPYADTDLINLAVNRDQAIDQTSRAVRFAQRIFVLSACIPWL